MCNVIETKNLFPIGKTEAGETIMVCKKCSDAFVLYFGRLVPVHEHFRGAGIRKR